MARVDRVFAEGLCVGCGLCAVACPAGAIHMRWTDRLCWRPEIDAALCTDCGACHATCPHAPDHLAARARRSRAEPDFGLTGAKFFIAHATDPARRLAGASGGFTSVLLEYLLSSGAVSAVVCSRPVAADFGRPHFEVFSANRPEDLTSARSSHYHPLCYHPTLSPAPEGTVVTGLPCVVDGLSRLPPRLRASVRYKVGICCSHNVSGALVEALARERGLRGPFLANLRDKVNIPDANHYNNCFRQGSELVRMSRFQTSHTRFFRNYLFARECCLYCPDFFAADADLSVKDGWGPLSSDPGGHTLVIVRNPELAVVMAKMVAEGVIVARECGREDILASVLPAVLRFKHHDVAGRMALKPALRQAMKERGVPFPAVPLSAAGRAGLRYRAAIALSDLFFFRFGRVPARAIVAALNPASSLRSAVKSVWNALGFARIDRVEPSSADRDRKQSPRVLIAGGYGYGNMGDEAQLATNLQAWREQAPTAELKVLSPNPDYTRSLHQVPAAPAPRVVLFHSDVRGDYGASNRAFKLRFLAIAPRILAAAALMRYLRLRSPLVRPAEFELLESLRRSDLLFLSGGGYLTGMTLSRLWDNMLLLRLARTFRVPVVLSGQTIGVFKDRLSPRFARELRHARLIYLRDPEESRAALAGVGVNGERVKVTFDDALFYRPDPAAIAESARRAGIAGDQRYWAVNFHDWGQTPEVARQVTRAMARALDQLYRRHGRAVLFVPMHRVDEEPIAEVRRLMTAPSLVADHGYDLDRAIGAIQGAEICVTMKHHPIVFALGGGIPAVAIALDDYYAHKNRGALGLFGLEDLAIVATPTALEGELVNQVDRLLADYPAVTGKISRRRDELENFRGEAIRRWLSEPA